MRMRAKRASIFEPVSKTFGRFRPVSAKEAENASFWLKIGLFGLFLAQNGLFLADFGLFLGRFSIFFSGPGIEIDFLFRPLLASRPKAKAKKGRRRPQKRSFWPKAEASKAKLLASRPSIKSEAFGEGRSVAKHQKRSFWRSEARPKAKGGLKSEAFG